MKHEITTLNQLQDFARVFLESTPKGTAIGLKGDLGAGKTTFVRTLIELIAKESGQPAPRVLSPTYVIETRYPGLKPCIEHFDLYRLNEANTQALTEIGYFDALEFVRDHHGFLFVEWPERAHKEESLSLSTVLSFSLLDKGRFVEVWRQSE